MTNKKLCVLLFILFYSIALFTRIYWAEHKEGFHGDEGLSIVVANYSEYIWEKNYEIDKIFTGKEVKEMSFCNDGSIKGAVKDVIRLYRNNKDVPHTNLYYSLLRFSLLGLETGEMKEIFTRGLILNLIFFSISFIFFFLLIRLIFENNFISIVATFCTFMSTATISNTLFLRPYQLQEAIFIVFAYFIFKFIIDNKNKIIRTENKYFININLKILIPTSIVTALTLLTGYYTIIYFFLFGLFIIWYNKKENNFDKQTIIQEMTFYSVALFLAFLFAQAIYSNYLLGYLGYRSTGVFYTLISERGVFDNLILSIGTAFKFLYKHYFFNYVLGVIAILSLYLFITKAKPEFTVKQIGLFLITIAFTFIIIYIAPFKVLRYVMSLFPFLIILPIILLKSIKKTNFRILFSVLLLASFTISAYNEQNIEHLFKDRAPSFAFTKETDIPVLVIFPGDNYWSYADIVPYFNDKQKYVFAKSIDEIDSISVLKDFEEFYVAINIFGMRGTPLHIDNKFKILSEYYAAYVIDVDEYYFKCFKLKRE